MGGIMGKIIQVKISKGGVGKTFLTIQVASLLAALEKKVIILTTDPQNDVFGMLKGEITEEMCDRGLKEAVLHNTDYEVLSLRKNLYYIPLEFDGYFSSEFFKRLPKFLLRLREEYDYIFIDSNPTPRTDKAFLELSDYVIIPTIGSSRSIQGLVSVLDTVNPNKILAIVFNQFKNTKLQMEVYQELKKHCISMNRENMLTEPIPYIAFIEELVAKRKTIWESKSKKIMIAQSIIMKIVEKISLKG